MPLQTISWTCQIDFYILTRKFWKNPVKKIKPQQFLGNLNAVAVCLTHKSTSRSKAFRKQNIAFAIQNKSNSFTIITKDENDLMDIQCVDGEITNEFSLAKLFVPQSLLIKAKRPHTYPFLCRSGLLFSRPFGNETVQSLVMAASVPERKISNLQDPVVITFEDQSSNKTKRNKIKQSSGYLRKTVFI